MDRKRRKNTGRTRLCASLTMSAGAQGCTRTRFYRGGGYQGQDHTSSGTTGPPSVFPDFLVRFFFLRARSGSHFFVWSGQPVKKTSKSMSVQNGVHAPLVSHTIGAQLSSNDAHRRKTPFHIGWTSFAYRSRPIWSQSELIRKKVFFFRFRGLAPKTFSK